MKHQVALHLWQDASHCREWRNRLWELRVSDPDRGMGDSISQFFAQLASAQSVLEFVAGVYLVLKPEMIAAYELLAKETAEVLDAPTIAIVRRILPEKRAQLEWLTNEVLPHCNQNDQPQTIENWRRFAQAALAHVGGIDGTSPAGAAPVPPPAHGLSPLPFPRAQRDERFTVTLAGMPMPDDDDRAGKVLYQFFNYAQEMQAVETLGSILWETTGMEWEFYHDLARHCYDEERHSAMGEQRLAALGHRVTDFPHTVANYGWRQLVGPLHRYCVLTAVIEVDSFRYKHQSYQKYIANNDHASAEAVLWDIMDETTHVRFGQKWVPELMKRFEYRGTADELIAECRDLVVKNSVNPLQKNAAGAPRPSVKSEPAD
jgi:hypothetical protein